MAVFDSRPPVFAPFIRDADFAVRRPWNVPERRLLDYLLVYIQDGSCRFDIEGQEYALQSGDFCLIQPGQRVALQGLTATVTPYAHFDLAFNPRREASFATRPGQMNLSAYADLLQPQLDAFGGHIPTRFHPPERASFVQSWLQIIRWWNEGDNWKRLQAENLLGSLVLRCLSHNGEAHPDSQTPALAWIPSFISTRLADPISVDDMAQRAGLSSSRFNTLFRHTFGTTPARYLGQMRVQHAAELLETTMWTLAHIARLCGFADVHHFAKAFKRAMHSTPGQHRRGARKRADSVERDDKAKT